MKGLGPNRIRVRMVGGISGILGACLLCVVLAWPAWAADYPKKTINLCINLAAGSGLDLTARVFAQYLQEELKVPVIVVNNTDGGGKKVVEEVFQAKPDGYTLLANLEMRNIQSELAYQPSYRILEFTPIICMTKVDMVMVARKDAPFNTLKELKALSQQKPINASTPGAGTLSHFLILRLKREGGFSMEPVPFKASSLGLTALIGGHVDITVCDLNSASVHKDQLKFTCTFGRERSKFIPEVATATEQGFPFVTEDTIGILAPPKLPKDIAVLLENAFAKVRSRPEVQEKMKSFGRTLYPLSGAEYHKVLAQTYKVVEGYKDIFKAE